MLLGTANNENIENIVDVVLTCLIWLRRSCSSVDLVCSLLRWCSALSHHLLMLSRAWTQHRQFNVTSERDSMWSSG